MDNNQLNNNQSYYKSSPTLINFLKGFPYQNFYFSGQATSSNSFFNNTEQDFMNQPWSTGSSFKNGNIEMNIRKNGFCLK